MANFILRNPIVFIDGTGFDTVPDNEEIFANTRPQKNISFNIGQAVSTTSNTVFNQLSTEKLIIDNQSLVLTKNVISGSFTQTAFDFAVTGSIVGQGLILALIVGFLGGVLPARRAATQDITAALRAI